MILRGIVGGLIRHSAVLWRGISLIRGIHLVIHARLVIWLLIRLIVGNVLLRLTIWVGILLGLTIWVGILLRLTVWIGVLLGLTVWVGSFAEVDVIVRRLFRLVVGVISAF